MADPRLGPVLEALAEAYRERFGSAVEAAGDPGSGPAFSPTKLVVTGGVVVVVIVAEIIHACVEGPHPEPGTSLRTHC